MNLREARVIFTILFATKLIPKAIELDFEPAFDEITNHQGKGHMLNSLHYSGCAGDLLLYKDHDYQTDAKSYQLLGEYWEGLDKDCKWGEGGKMRTTSHTVPRNYLEIEDNLMPFKPWITKDEMINDFAIHLDIEGAQAWMAYLDNREGPEIVKGFQVEQLVLREMKKVLE